MALKLLWFDLFLMLVLACRSFIGALVLKHRHIVGAPPGKLQTKVQPREFGQWVNPFIGTGGFPWVCGNNFPGAMVPFGMVRLGPGDGIHADSQAGVEHVRLLLRR